MGQPDEGEPFPELEGDIPSGLPSPSRSQLPSQKARREQQHPPRLNTTYLSLPLATAHAPLSPPPLRIQKKGNAREGSLGLGLSSIYSQTGLPPSPSPRQSDANLPKEVTTTPSQLQPRTQAEVQRLSSSPPIASNLSLPPTPRARRQSLSNGMGTGNEQMRGPGNDTSLPATPRPSVPPSPAYAPARIPSVGGVGASPVAGLGLTAWDGERIERVRRRTNSGGRVRTPSTSETSPPILGYTFSEKPHPLTAIPARSKSGTRESRPAAEGSRQPNSATSDRCSSVRTSTAAATRGMKIGSISESMWANRTPFVPISRRYTDESTPATPVDQETAQRQRLRSDSTASTVAGTEYEYPIMNYCPARLDVHVTRSSWLTISIIVLSIYSTSMSGLWFFTSILQPRWGHNISSDKHARLDPDTASLLTTLFAKTIEMSFVTVFVGFLGQVLSRRAFIRDRAGITLSEISMKNWVVQPGSLLTQWDTLPYAGFTFLGVLSLLATVCATFYTTASDAMVTPKLKFGDWHGMTMTGFVRSSYANPKFVRENCATPLTPDVDPDGGAACLDVEYSGKSYHNLLAFMEIWQGIHANGTSKAENIDDRPHSTAMLHDNTTVTSSWIEGEFSNVTSSFEKYGRIVNNVTLAVPHPGVYAAATDPINGILQPNDLSGVGEYAIKASVVSPTVNALCVNMDKDELAPLVYTEFPSARTNTTDIPGQVTGAADWERDIPGPGNDEFLNRTVVDEIFRWGPRFGRRPPMWRMFPIANNIITNTTVQGTDTVLADAIYILAKSPAANMAGNYTICELRSWLATSCSSKFSIKGTEGGELKALCEKDGDENRFDKLHPGVATPKPSGDWKNMVDQWRLAIDLNGGIQNNNASNARILTGLVINQLPELERLRDDALLAERQGEKIKTSGGLPALLPSMAEALAVLISSTLLVGGINTPFDARGWEFESHELGLPGNPETFNASIKSQEFVSGHNDVWQAVVFYPILLSVFAINALCLCYLVTSLMGERGWRCTRGLARKCCFVGRGWRWWRNKKNGDTEDGKSGKRDAEGVKGNGKMGTDSTSCANAPGGLVTDYTEPSNLFALAINSPPSRQLAGSCGAGPRERELAVPFRVGYQEKGNHYYFEEASDAPCRGRWRGRGLDEDREAMGTGMSYRNLSVSKSWL
ncbi:hypothetical protein MKZ38_005176 [Zalerion maritima]|uniref:Uncharacterized protein n=1 Tax=Zalerion maritima TaxID=339359 RepID=A0AAD5RW65_9PEZI|nr:hypothetical protein MKZ38_005176 [Zalerion maritima]